MANKRIMIVEDEWVTADDIQTSLQKLGYAVSSVVSSGDDAIKKAEEDKPDLVLMDIVLQGEMDGIEAARQIHSRFRIPIIYLTAFADKTILERAKITEPFGYMIKPFQDRELHSNIEMALFKYKIENELRESEEKHRIMIETAQDAIICIDEKEKINVWNKASENIFGYSNKEIIGQPIITIIPEEYKKKHKEGIKRFIETGKPNFIGKTIEILGRTKAGNVIPIEMSLSFQELEEGQYNFMGIIRDITSQKEAERKLIEKTNEIESINRELRDFVYIVSHDLKEPLFTIEGFSKRLTKKYDDKLDEKGKRYINRINANVKIMSNRIHEIMEVVKIGTVKYEFSYNDIGVIVNEVADELEGKIKRGQIKLILRDDLPSVYCEPIRIKGVFTNLVINAIKFIGNDNHKEIRIGCDKDGDYFKFSVEDTGIGIRKEHQEQVFKIFNRLKDIEVEGSGVGLTIVKKIIEMHKGKVWVESPVKEERGTRFCFTIPVSGE